ncbi:MAG: sigma-70 family RNA polymerase sigma factor [Verrucomicrobia bacterium]|nr:sigma-70 family RNA polymerase sigma factor [Verrucomicrobiota bacterium]NBU09540.1 sigma-70 family RNA polymerase sigma factor [Pseudomonadota bacterium]NDA65302.1 sigma-70 family RNA polymerase sigma factor [Verrucomicrobiota bacterium]NDB77169.1 sigma-70 family RNA polymerase sigma factor [Verrucomicrobiota bacterium]NDD37124.1 sigma-70 family RNA polymerase sigma factor [Verrucomicrobiota bacterium]
MAEVSAVDPRSVEGSPQPDDLTLVRQAQAGDANAYDELVRRYQRQIYGVVYHMTSHHEDANDLTQEAFVKAWQALKSFKGDSSFFTWIYRIAVNRTLNHLKQRKFRDGKHAMSLNDLDVEAEHHPDLVALASDKTPRRALALEELKEKLNVAMQRLSENHRIVVTLHDIQGLPHDEIAKVLGCNTATVRTRLFYARQQLQGILSDYLK